MVHNQGRTEAGAQFDEQRSAAFITADGLHRCVIDQLDWAAKRFLKSEANPALSQVVRIAYRLAVAARVRGSRSKSCRSSNLAAAFFTAAIIFLGVIFGPDGIFTGVRWPVSRVFICVPPMSTTKTFGRVRVIQSPSEAK
jgi:hypothetical protein